MGMNREEFLEVYRHSLAHVLAKAVIEIYGIENKNNQETKVRARDPAGGPGHVPSVLRWLLGGGDLPGSPILARALTCLPLEAPGPQAPSLFLHS